MSRPVPRKKVVRKSGRVPLASTAFRLRVLVLAVAILFSVAAARAIQIQVVSAPAMAAEAAAKMTVARDVPAQRGTITGRDGQVMALTEATVNIIADPSMIATNGKEPEAMREADHAKAAAAPAEMAAIIAAHTGEPADTIEAKLRHATTTNAQGTSVPVKYTILAKQVRSSMPDHAVSTLQRQGVEQGNHYQAKGAEPLAADDELHGQHRPEDAGIVRVLMPQGTDRRGEDVPDEQDEHDLVGRHGTTSHQ